MRVKSCLPAALCAVLLIVATAYAQSAKPTTVPVEDRLMPGERFEDVPLDDVLSFIHEAVPAFNVVVVRGPNVPANYPTIPRMTVKNITIGQFLQFLQESFPDLTVAPIEGPESALYVVRIPSAMMPEGLAVESRPPQPGGFPGGMGMVGGGGGLFEAGPMPVISDTPLVRVYKLSEIVASISGGQPDKQKQALNDVLSLIQAALEQIDDGGKDKAVIKVHEQTQTLLFKGTVNKQQVLEQIIQTLQPDVDPKQASKVRDLETMTSSLKREIDDREVRVVRLQKELDRAQDEMDAMRREYMQSKAENATLKVQLDQVKSGAKPQ